MIGLEVKFGPFLSNDWNSRMNSCPPDGNTSIWRQFRIDKSKENDGVELLEEREQYVFEDKVISDIVKDIIAYVPMTIKFQDKLNTSTHVDFLGLKLLVCTVPRTWLIL